MYLSAEEKQALVSRYHAGESVAEICADTGVARSTLYNDHNRLRSCGQPAGIYQDEATNPKAGAKS